MALPVYALEIDETLYSFEELRIVGGGAVLITTMGAADVLEISQKMDGLTDSLSELLPNNAYVRLLEDGVCIFAGRVTPRMRATSGAVRTTFRIVGGWAELTGRYYAQPWAAGAGDGILYGRVALGWNGATSEFVNTGQQIRAAVLFALSHGAPLQIGTIHNGILIVPEYAENLSCAQVISRMLEFTPHYVPFFDYATTPPTFHCMRASDGIGESAGRLEGIVPHAGDPFAAGLVTVSIAAEMFVGTLDVRQSFENEIKGLVMAVKKQILEPEEDVEEGQERKYLTSWLEVKVPDMSAEIGEDGVIPMSFDTTDFEGMEDGEITELLTTQAETLFEAVQHLQWGGSGTIKGQTSPRVPGVGYRINIANGEEAWGTMNAIVRSSRRDLLNGTNTSAWGPPAAWTLAKLLALAMGKRRRTAFTQSLREEQSTGRSPEQNGGSSANMGKKESAEGEKGLTLPALPFGPEVKIVGATSAGYSLYETTEECQSSS